MTPPIRKITPEVFSRWLGVDVRTVRRWIVAKELPALNVATGSVPHYVIYRKDAVVFLRRRGISPAQLADFGLENEK